VYGSDDNFARLERATSLARERDVTPNQVALAYLLAQAFPVAALVTARNVGQLHDSLGALSVRLSPAELRWLESGTGAEPARA
jgi:aryl-alcohol dehydrogenase-like predicted oxidoreductase